MKLVILMLAFNEEEKIEKTILRIPRTLPNVDKVEILVVNDGSTDNTVELAMNAGADKIVTHKMNMGVGAGFMTGIRNAISMDADIVVTVDADGEANLDYLPDLINPIINNQFDVVVGTRFWKGNPSTYKKLNYFGNQFFTKLVSFVAGHKFTDTQTGFRAYSKDAIDTIHPTEEGMSVSTEILLKISNKGLSLAEVPITISYDGDTSEQNPVPHGVSVLVNTLKYVSIRHPLPFYAIPGIALIIAGIISGGVFLDAYLNQQTVFYGSLLASVTLFLLGAILIVTAIILFAMANLIRDRA